MEFMRLFEHGGVYLLPDQTLVVARYCDLNDRPRWWFVEAAQEGPLGQLLAVVLPDGHIWNYVAGSDQAVRVPQRSDLMLEDLRPVASQPSVRAWLARTGSFVALLWAADGIGTLLDVATALAA